MARLMVRLTNAEVEALRLSAEKNLRPLREQARFLIVRGLAAEIVAQAGNRASATDPAQPVAAVEGGRHAAQPA